MFVFVGLRAKRTLRIDISAWNREIYITAFCKKPYKEIYPHVSFKSSKEKFCFPIIKSY